MKKRIIMLSLAALLASSWAMAGTHEVGPGQTYPNLEALRNPVVVASGDTIRLHADDASLTNQFYFTVPMTLTIQSSGAAMRTISGALAADQNSLGGIVNFANGPNTLTLASVTFADGRVLDVNNVDIGRGGALYSEGALTLSVVASDSVVAFHNNQATVVSNNAYVTNSGRGGAIYAGNTLTMNDGVYTFSQNQANAGSDKSGNSYYSGWGGAIYASDALYTHALTMTNGTYTFSQNQANAGNNNGGNSFSSGLGGAIFASYDLTMDGGSYLFRENSASDGVGNTGDDDNSGLGGAIYAWSNFSLVNADASFINNRAVNQSGNPTSGRGGAIFHNEFNNHEFELGAADGKTILFQGNTHGTGEANSIYFGYTSRGGSRTTKATFEAAASGRIIMYDPIESQKDGLAGTYIYGNVTVDITKKGTGIWSLGGVSNLAGAASLTLDEGIFHQMDEYSQLNLSNTTTAAFTAAADSIYRPTVNGQTGRTSTISALTADVEADAKFQVGGAATLTPGREYIFENVITTTTGGAADNFIDLKSDLLTAELKPDGEGNYDLIVTAKAMPSSSGFSDNAVDSFFLGGGYLGNYDVMTFVDDIYNTGLAAADKAKVADVNLFSGDFVANLSVMSLQAARAFADAAFARIDVLGRLREDVCAAVSPTACADPVALYASDRRNRVWTSGLGSWASLDEDGNRRGFDSRVFGAALGYDFAFTDCFAAGAYAGYARLKAENGRDTARLDADHYYLGLYANYDQNDIVANASAYLGRSDNETEHRYRAFAVKAAGDFDAVHYGAKFDLGYRFRPGRALDLTPFVGLDWHHVRNAAYKERQRGTTASVSVFARRFSKENFDSLQIPLGLRFGATFAAGSGTWLRLGGTLAYARELADRNGNVSARMLGHATTFTAKGVKIGRDVFRAGASVSARFRDRYEAEVEYNLELRENYHDNRVKVSFGVRF